MQKKRIVHVIDSLARGGAETLLVDLLPDLFKEYHITLVALSPALEFEKEQLICDEYITLEFAGPKDLFSTVSRLKSIINRVNPHLVRTQLFWSNIVGRLACPKEIPLFFSVHATMDEDPIAWYKKSFLNITEKWSYRRRHHMIGVTNAVINSFEKMHGSVGATFLLNNYVRDVFFSHPYTEDYQPGTELRVIAVSNLRVIKNIPYMLEVMKELKNEPISLTIVGEGSLREMAEKYILDNGLKVELKGKMKNVDGVLPDYNLFISPSTVEGFGIAVAEAMSVGLPVIVSDIPVYREICGDKAAFIDNTETASLVGALRRVISGQLPLSEMSKASRLHAVAHFSKKGYMEKLKRIYEFKHP